MDPKYQGKKFISWRILYSVWSQNEEESTDKKELTDKEESIYLSDMPLLEGDEVKKGKGLKISTPRKLLTRLPILLSQRKAGNNWYKLKNEIRQIFCISIIKSLKNFRTI